jgi:hypothetical protein
LVRSASLPLAARSDVAASPDGSAYVLVPAPNGRAEVRRIGSAEVTGWSTPAVEGAAGAAVQAPAGIAGAIRAVGASVFVHLLPLDAWVPVTGPPPTSGGGGLSVGEPLPNGRQLLSVVRGRRVRLGTLVAGRVRDPVELTFGCEVGELAMAAPDGHGGYWAVAHVWRGGSRTADAFQVVHVDMGKVASTFLLPSGSYTSGSPQSDFRLAAGGVLYQLRTSATGVRVVRYGIGGAS